MVKVPDSTKSSLDWTLRARAKERWPALAAVTVKHRAGFAYITGHTSDGENLPLCRLRYGGSASRWGFAIYRASHDDYEDSFLPTGSMAGTPEEALRHRLRPLPRRPHRLDHTPDELTGGTTSGT